VRLTVQLVQEEHEEHEPWQQAVQLQGPILIDRLVCWNGSDVGLEENVQVGERILEFFCVSDNNLAV
jgi:hypothetical protein